MQFTLNGPDIPQDLVMAQERGATIFVCGAGASMTAGLPSFRELIAAVYHDLGETWVEHIAESQIMSYGTSLSGQYDRILRILEKRLAASDVRQARGVRRRIRKAIDTNLAAPVGADLSNHLALLELSRGDDNIPRLLTTNFDNLFERAWWTLKGDTLNSHAGPAMPRPGTSAFEGVLHLHGRIADVEMKLEETDLVLNSAEFGEAYLRSGWATRYVYDLARTATLVLVGYQADDPPMRYLLEVLEADRARYPDLKTVYAFAAAPKNEIVLQRELWRAKGIEPILYSISDPKDHTALYHTLHEWCRYAASPSKWRQVRLATLVSKLPKETTPAELREAHSLLEYGNATHLLVDVSPSSSWWPIFFKSLSTAGKSDALFCWINKRLADPEMLQACLVNPPDLRVLQNLKTQLDFQRSKLPDLLMKAWWLFASSAIGALPHNSGGRWHVVVSQIKEGKIDQSLRNAAVEAVLPRLQISQTFTRRDPYELPTKLQHLIHVSFNTAEAVSTAEILLAWPHDVNEEEALFRLANRALEESLDTAFDAEFLDGIDLASHDVKSLSVSAAFGVETGFAPLTKLVVGLWERILERNPGAALRLAAAWCDAPYLLQRRLYLHALKNKNIYGAATIVNVLSGLDDETFWINDAEREVVTLLGCHWNDLNGSDRASLEQRIINGPPRTLARTDLAISDEDWQATSYYYTFRVLRVVTNAGGILSQSAADHLAEIIAAFPPDALTLPQHEPTLPGTAFVGPRGSTEPFDNVTDDELVAQALQAQQSDFLGAGNSWQLVCDADPRRAIRAIATADTSTRWRHETILPLLNATIEINDLDLDSELFSLLAEMPQSSIDDAFLTNATRWVFRRAERCPEQLPNEQMQAFWDRLCTYAELVSSTSPKEVLNVEDAVNSPLGLLTLALLQWVNKPPGAINSGFPIELELRLKRLAKILEKGGLEVRVLLVRELAYLHSVDADLIAEDLIPHLFWSDPDASALWRARAQAGDGPGSAVLFNTLKPAFLEAVHRTEELPGAATGLARQLLWVSMRKLDTLGNNYDLTTQEVRVALTNAPRELLDRAAWLLSTSMGDETVEETARGKIWRDSIGPLFAAIWPLDASSLDPKVSRKLVWMALECGDAFEDAVSSVVDFVVPYNLVSIRSSMMHNSRREVLTKKYPAAFIQLLSQIVDKNDLPFDLGDVLDDWLIHDGTLATNRSFLRLTALRRLGEA